MYKLLAADQLDKPCKEINFLKNSFSKHLEFSNGMEKINQMMVSFDTCSSSPVHFIMPRQNGTKWLFIGNDTIEGPRMLEPC